MRDSGPADIMPRMVPRARVGRRRLRAERWFGASDAGPSRGENQDAWHADAGRGVFFVADGMSGHAAGLAAAGYVERFLPGTLEAAFLPRLGRSEARMKAALVGTLADFSAEMRERAGTQPSLKGMGATVALAVLDGPRVVVAWLGDSRAYLRLGDGFECCTRDHSLTARLVELGQLSAPEASAHPLRSKLTRFVGQDGFAQAEVRVLRPGAPARLLLCTDGISSPLAEGAIGAVMAEEASPEAAVRRLVAEALRAGGTDNATALVIDLAAGG